MVEESVFNGFLSSKYSNPNLFRKEFESAIPFPNIELLEFFDTKLLIKVKEHLIKQHFTRKESDLYSFYQTFDLKNTEDKVLSSFISKLYSKEFIKYMENLTSFRLSNQVDVAGTCYDDTDFLLCHDDQLEGRKIAFLIYLADFKKDEGGALALYDLFKQRKDKLKLPGKVVKRIIPKFNKFAFFEVSTISYHAVEEVLKNKKRYAIGGWFHERK